MATGVSVIPDLDLDCQPSIEPARQMDTEHPELKLFCIAEPDTVGSDGIYSGLVTRYPAPGHFSLTVRATDGAGSARVITRPLEADEALTDDPRETRFDPTWKAQAATIRPQWTTMEQQ